MSRGRDRTGPPGALDSLLHAARHVWKVNGTFIILGLGILTVVLGSVGFEHLATMRGLHQNYLDYIYMTLKMFPINTVDEVPPAIWELQIARFLAPAFTFLALLKFVSILFSERLQQLQLSFVRDHVIVCGMSPTGFALVKNFRERDWRVVVIDPGVESKEIETSKELGAFIVASDPMNVPALQTARVAKARYLFAVTDSDSLNSEIAVAAEALVGTGGRGHRHLTCFVHIVEDQLVSLLREQQLRAGSDRFTWELFNIYQIAGQHILNEHPAFSVEQKPPDCHVLIVGSGRMGESLIFHMIKQWRDAYGNSKSMKITLVDEKAQTRASMLCTRHPSLASFCEIIPMNMETASAEFLRGDFLFEDDRIAVTKIYVCLPDQSLGLSAALHLNQLLDHYAVSHKLPKPDVPIVLRTVDDGLNRLFHNMRRGAGSFSNLYAYPFIERTCNVEYITGGLNETIAMAMHEDYAMKQRANGETTGTNPSVQDWDVLPETLKISNRNQAIHIHRKIEAIGCEIMRSADWEEDLYVFDEQDVEMLAMVEHDRFVEERKRQGWKYGPVKDVDRKITPYLVPYESLPEDVRELDRNAIRALPAVLARADLKIVRLHGADSPEGRLQEREITVAGK